MALRQNAKTTISAAALMIFGCVTVSGQQTTIQQPVFNTFGTNTTVTVPDGGSALLGGVDSARFGSTSRGTPVLGRIPGVGRLFQNRAIGSELNSTRNHVRVRIIDLQEMEEDLLGSPSATYRSRADGAVANQRFGGANRPHQAAHDAARFLSKNIGRQPNSAQTPTRQATIEPATPISRARSLLARGDAALAEGRIELATRYYEEAERVAQLPTSRANAEVARRPNARQAASSSSADDAIVLGQ